MGSGVVIEVKDRGRGMDAETLQRAGDPFFTTKDPGRGMGLGLFLVRTLADRLGGRFGLRSELGVGTVARLELPRSGAETPAAPGT
jgi:two-component system sensor histidine kinase RegB